MIPTIRKYFEQISIAIFDHHSVCGWTPDQIEEFNGRDLYSINHVHSKIDEIERLVSGACNASTQNAIIRGILPELTQLTKEFEIYDSSIDTDNAKYSYLIKLNKSFHYFEQELEKLCTRYELNLTEIREGKINTQVETLIPEYICSNQRKYLEGLLLNNRTKTPINWLKGYEALVDTIYHWHEEGLITYAENEDEKDFIQLYFTIKGSAINKRSLANAHSTHRNNRVKK